MEEEDIKEICEMDCSYETCIGRKDALKECNEKRFKCVKAVFHPDPIDFNICRDQGSDCYTKCYGSENVTCVKDVVTACKQEKKCISACLQEAGVEEESTSNF